MPSKSTAVALSGLALLASGPLVVRHYAYLPLYGYEGKLPPETAAEKELAARLRAHVEAIASAPHNTAHPAEYELAARYIEKQLASFGYRVETQEYEALGEKVRNIHVAIGTPEPGKAVFVVGAHYDSAGLAPGANDNGSGTAAVIELARALKGFDPANHYLRLVLFANEERPHFGRDTMGSIRFAAMLNEREPIAGMISVETIGAYFDEPGTQRFPVPLNLVYRDKGNFITFVGLPRARELVHRALGSFRGHTKFPSIGGISHSFIPGIAWSDHASFDAVGVPAMMITDTALFRYAHYHKPTDTPDKLDYDRIARVTKGIERMLREIVD